MIGRGLFLLLFAASSITTPVCHAQQLCGQALDYVVQAREKARPGITRSELDFGNQLLKHAENMCPGKGDVYYCRYLYENQLGNKRLAEINLAKAREFDSELLRNGGDPFSASLPEARLTI